MSDAEMPKEADELEQIRRQGREWLRRGSAEYLRVWKRLVRATSGAKTDDEVSIDTQHPDRVSMAVQKIAYAHVHLRGIVEKLATEPRAGGWTMTPSPATTTSSPTDTTSIITSHSTAEPPTSFAVEAGRPLLVHRAYVEWALVLARKLSHALSRNEAEADQPTDVLVAHLIGDPEYKVRGLDSALIGRINKRPIHMVYFDDPGEGEWDLGEIRRVLGEAVDQLVRDLDEHQPTRARMLRDKITKYEAEIDRL